MRSVLLLLVALTVFILDQLTKYWVRQNIPLGQSWPGDWPVRFTFQVNTGAAFGLLQDQGIFLVLVAVAVIGVILFYHRFLGQDGILIRISLGLMLGGALGNLVDRLRDGFVTDFIDFQVWPIFNIADSSISVGVAILAYYLLFRQPKPEPAAETSPPRLDGELSREG